jgi:hypothetical protein
VIVTGTPRSSRSTSSAVEICTPRPISTTWSSCASGTSRSTWSSFVTRIC